MAPPHLDGLPDTSLAIALLRLALAELTTELVIKRKSVGTHR